MDTVDTQIVQDLQLKMRNLYRNMRTLNQHITKQQGEKTIEEFEEKVNSSKQNA